MQKALIAILAVVLFSCDPTTEEKEADTHEANLKWADMISNGKNPSGQYLKEAVFVNDQGDFLTGNDNAILWVGEDAEIGRIYSLFDKLARENRGIYYEIGGFETDQESFKHLIIWRKQDSVRYRELELISRADSSDLSEILPMIDEKRDQWMKYCNAHLVDSLAHKVYDSLTLYYNHKPMVVGREDLIREYQYMANPNYNLQLTPYIVEPVNENIVFEIGQCSGSYGGMYTIVWRRQPDGDWLVLLDSNI